MVVPMMNFGIKNIKNQRGINKMKIKKMSDTAIVPTRATDGSAGYDLYADIDTELTIEPHTTVMIKTNIAMEIPDGYFGGVFPRSGISTKRGLRLANCVGVIDSDFRNGIGVPLHNDTNEPQTIAPHERVAQLVFLPYKAFDFELVDELNETDRGLNGFGSTGR